MSKNSPFIEQLRNLHHWIGDAINSAYLAQEQRPQKQSPQEQRLQSTQEQLPLAEHL